MRFRLQNQKHNPAMIITPATTPITIPAIAPPDKEDGEDFAVLDEAPAVSAVPAAVVEDAVEVGGRVTVDTDAEEA